MPKRINYKGRVFEFRREEAWSDQLENMQDTQRQMAEQWEGKLAHYILDRFDREEHQARVLLFDLLKASGIVDENQLGSLDISAFVFRFITLCCNYGYELCFTFDGEQTTLGASAIGYWRAWFYDTKLIEVRRDFW